MPVNEVNFVEQGITITIVSMSVVFSFFIIMITSMNILANLMPIIAKFSPEIEPESVSAVKKPVEQFDEIALVVAAVKSQIKG